MSRNPGALWARQVALSAALAATAAGCALGRSHVKSLRDRDASLIALDDVNPTTVSALNALPARCGPTFDRRVRDEEFRVYQVVGIILRAKRERDRDIHIVLEDPDDRGKRVIVESDDPDFRGNTASPYRDRLAVGRRMLDDLLQKSGFARVSDLRGARVRVTGVGFFDMSHFQRGRSRSCIELHPILAIELANP